jgi:methyltransferase (TIGR00027 family)
MPTSMLSVRRSRLLISSRLSTCDQATRGLLAILANVVRRLEDRKMKNFSNSMSMAKWRYIQSVYETAELQNPDSLARHFLPALERWYCAWLSQSELATMRSNPFYYYLDARTRYYDGIFLDAISDKVQYIVNIGCGSDTRSYRFAQVLEANGVKVLECDQPESIADKQRIVKRRDKFDHVAYMPIDLNDGAWPDFEQWLNRNNSAKTLVLMEGVSPYVNSETFRRFLSLLERKLSAGSRVVYDFKLAGVADSFGLGGRTKRPFRLPTVKAEIVSYHEKFSYRVMHLEESAELTARLLPGLEKSRGPLFAEDGLIQLEVRTDAVMANRVMEAV